MILKNCFFNKEKKTKKKKKKKKKMEIGFPEIISGNNFLDLTCPRLLQIQFLLQFWQL